jgi:hypothetical protein
MLGAGMSDDCLAQSDGMSDATGSVGGRVLGPGGQPLAGAQIQMENRASGESTRIVSDAGGSYWFPAVPPGSYTVRVHAPGLSEWEADNLTVGMDTAARLEARLAALAVHRTVLVDAGQGHAGATGHPAEGERDVLDDLPNNTRQWSRLAGLLGAASPGTDGELSFRGLSPLMNNITVDGLSNKLAFRARERGTQGYGFATSQASVGEFQAPGSGFSPEYGGRLTAVTRSGSGHMRGRAVFYDRGRFGQASNAFSKVMEILPAGGAATGPVLYLNGQPVTYVEQPWRAPDRRQQWEISAGGPVRRGRAYWFFSWGEYLRSDPAVARANEPEVFFAPPSAAVLTVLEARLAGSTSPVVKRCPAWSPAAGSTAMAACAYASVLHDLSGMLGTVPRSSHQTTVFPKLTWRVTDRNELVLQYNRMRRVSPYGLLLGASETSGVGSFGNTSTSDDVAAGQWEFFASPHLVNSARLQVSRNVLAHAPGAATEFEKQFTANAWGLAPEISIDTSRGFSFGTLATANKRQYPAEKRWQFADAITWIRGPQALRFGYGYDHVADAIDGLNGENGAYSYASLEDFVSDMLAPNSCGGTANALGRYPCYSHYRQTVGYAKWDFQTADYAAYLADQWRIRRLTLTLGLRYEYDQLPNTNQALVNAAIPGTASLPHERSDFGPRAGFAWDLLGDGRTVLRGGFGLYFARVPNATVFSALTSTGATRSPRDYRWRPMDVAAPTFPSVFASGETPYVDASAPDQRSSAPEVVFFDRHFRRPQIDQMDLSLAQTLGGGTVLTMTAMATNGHDLSQFVDTNIDPTAVARVFYSVQAPGPGGDAGPLAHNARQVAGFTNLVYAPARFYFLRTDPRYGAMTDIVSETNSSYRGAMVRVVRRMSRAITVNAGYTWSHAIDDNQNEASFAERNNLYDPADWKLEHGTSNYDVRQRIAGGIVLREPWRLRGGKGLLLGGYSLAGAGDWRTGLPYTMRIAGAAPTPSCSYAAWLQAGGAGGGGARCLESVTQPNGVITGVGVPVAGLGPGLNGSGGENLIPPIGRNTFRFPVSAGLDLRLAKRIQLSDRYSFDLMAESFNALNHRNVTRVQTAGYRLGNDSVHANMGTLTWQSGMKPGTRTTMVNGTTQTDYIFDPTAAFGGVTNANSTPTLRERQIQAGLRLNF